MSLLKYLERLKRMDDLIRRKATGSPEEFSRKLNISRSQFLQDLKELREMGAPIEYCKITRSYIYTKPCQPILSFNEKSIQGGNYFSPIWLDSNDLLLLYSDTIISYRGFRKAKE